MHVFRSVFIAAAAMLTALSSANAAPKVPVVIFVSERHSENEMFAAKELRRYIYLRTGGLAVIVEGIRPHGSPGDKVPAILVARKDRPEMKANAEAAALKPGEYILKSRREKTRDSIDVCGGDDAGVLYGAYRLIERFGVRFYLHGDVVPDGRMEFSVPAGLDERGSPLFETRGIQPFHDFPEGPDWWDADDYKAIISQLPKLGMNFFALHTYPEGGPNAEPTVWIGPAEDANPDGTVRASYPSSWQNTLRGNWGYAAKKTGDYTRGTSVLFDRDDYGSEVMRGFRPAPADPKAMNEVFDRAGAMFRDVFSLARSLGVKTCIGTETPLVVPKLVRERLAAKGMNPADSATVSALYEGMFRRIAATHPLDYFWFWTPEGWTWEGNTPTQTGATITDIGAARAALEKIGSPFRLATCGWVLGPVGNRSLFDATLPGGVALSCINRQVGMTPVDRAFASVKDRQKWAIPWLEDDPSLTAPQLWVGRMRQDARDALDYGCTGLIGIHWRTRILGPNVLALARAAWHQEQWGSIQASGPMDGRALTAVGPVSGTDEPDIYRTMRVEVTEYRFVVPNGVYTITFRFCEPEFEKAGQRVFGISAQGMESIPRIDLAAEAGKLRALDRTITGVRVSDSILRINFDSLKGVPCVSAIEIAGTGYAKRINCGGPALGTYDADWTAIPARFRPTGDFYEDWCASEFGPAAGPSASKLFGRIDGYLPRPADWVNGPGGIRPDPRPWVTVTREYSFVDEFAALKPLVKGPGALDRYEYWLETFRYLRAMGRLNCLRGELDSSLAKVKAERDSLVRARLARTEALPKYRAVVGGVDEVYRHLFPVLSTNGELGTVMNWEQHLLPMVLDAPRKELNAAAGNDIAPAESPGSYTGPPRLIVPTVRTSLAAGEPFRLRAIVIDAKPPRSVELLTRPLGANGEETFKAVPFVHEGRGVYRITVTGVEDDFEYRILTVTAGGTRLVFPPTTPEMNQTVVVAGQYNAR